MGFKPNFHWYLIMALEFMFDPYLDLTPRAQVAQNIILRVSGSSRGGMEEGMAHFRLNCCSLAGRYDFCHEGARESGCVVRGRARNEEEEGLACWA